jgi:hypothetical protein
MLTAHAPHSSATTSYYDSANLTRNRRWYHRERGCQVIQIGDSRPQSNDVALSYYRLVMDFSGFRSLKNRKRSTARCRNSDGYIQRMPHADRFGGLARSCSSSDAASSATCSASTASDRFSTERRRDSPRGCESGAAGPCNALTIPAAGTGFTLGRVCATSCHYNRRMRGGELGLPPLATTSRLRAFEVARTTCLGTKTRPASSLYDHAAPSRNRVKTLAKVPLGGTKIMLP